MQSQKQFAKCKLIEDDIPKLIELSASVGWDYDKGGILTIMSVGTVYGHKTEQGDIILAQLLFHMATIWLL